MPDMSSNQQPELLLKFAFKGTMPNLSKRDESGTRQKHAHGMEMWQVA